MQHLVLVSASATLGIGYVVAALLRVQAGWFRPVIRRWYWLSAVGCCGLSANQWWFLAQHVEYTPRVMNALVWAIIVMVSALIQPAIIVTKHRDMGVRPKK